MVWWKADQLARRPPHPPGAVALLTDSADGTITETAIANFACVIGSILFAPPWKQTLDGISLGVTTELCGIPSCYAPLPLPRVPEMNEAMLTGTGFCVAGVRQIDEHVLPWPGSVFRKLLAAWSDLVGVDIEKQFLDAT